MGIHIGHVALRVPDVDAYVDHITASLGLEVLRQSEDAAYLGTQTARHELELLRGDPAYDHVGLMVDSATELDAVVERALAAGATRQDSAPEPGCEASSTIVGPGGVAYQLYVPTVRGGQTLRQWLSGGLRRLGHLTFLSPESEAMVAFWRDGFGFRLSDEATGFTWMRCDAYHHTLAVGPHPEATILHHHAWEIQDGSALAAHCDRNAAAGRPQAWGPVRHGPGFNVAAYMPDAVGAMIEVYADLQIIEDDENHRPADWSNVPLALSLWGTMPSPEASAAGVPVASTPVAV